MAEYLSHAEVAQKFGISRRTLSRLMAKTPDLTYLRVGHSIMFRPIDVERLEDALTVSTAPLPVRPAIRRTVKAPTKHTMTARELILSMTPEPRSRRPKK